MGCGLCINSVKNLRTLINMRVVVLCTALGFISIASWLGITLTLALGNTVERVKVLEQRLNILSQEKYGKPEIELK